MHTLARLWRNPRLLIVLLVVALVVVALSLKAIYGWSAARRLQAAIARYEAQGETLDLAKLLPAPVPDHENFCATPALMGIPQRKGPADDPDGPEQRRKRFKALSLWDLAKAAGAPLPPESISHHHTGVSISAEVWLDWWQTSGLGPTLERSGNPAADLLLALPDDAALLKELAARIDLPKAQWVYLQHADLGKDFQLFSMAGHLSALWEAVQCWTRRAMFAAQAGEDAEALLCTMICLRLAEAALQEGRYFATSYAMNYASAGLDAIWTLCQQRRLDAASLRVLEQALARLDYAAAALLTLRVVACLEHHEALKLKNEVITLSDWLNLYLNSPLLYFSTSAYVDSAQATMLDFHWRHRIGPFRGVLPKPSQQGIEKDHRQLDFYFWRGTAIVNTFGIGWELFGDFPKKAHRTFLNMGRTACLLEMHYLSHGVYPETLSDLADRDAVLDPVTGDLLHYELTEDNRYRLWSPGQDGVDDGGQRFLNEKPLHPTAEHYRGDWVWDYLGEPAKESASE